MHLRAETIELLKSEDQRAPFIRIDTIGLALHQDRLFKMHPSDPRLEDGNIALEWATDVIPVLAANRIEGPVTPIRSDTAQDALITRPGMDVTVRLLPSGGAVFLAKLASGESLVAAATAASAHSLAFDLSLNIAGMIEAGVFTSIHHGNRP
jgi:hypothetical protein